MRKKGMLLASETLKIVIAVICISFLVFLLTSVYFADKKGKDELAAEALISKIENITSRTDFSTEKVTELTPAGWVLFGFIPGEKMPNSCAGMNCLCLCDELTIKLLDRQIKECDQNGYCLNIENLMKFDSIKIRSSKDPTSIEIYREENYVGIKEI